MVARIPSPARQREPVERAGSSRRLAVCGIAACLCCLVLTSCSRQLPPISRTALEGDRAVLKKFEGRWYDDSWIPMASVTGGRSPSLSLRVPPGYRISDGRLRGEEIQFTVSGGGKPTTQFVMRLLADDAVTVGRPGQGSSWCGTCRPPRYRKIGGRVRQEAEELKERVADWLADVMVDVL